MARRWLAIELILSLSLTLVAAMSRASDDCSYVRLDAPGKAMEYVIPRKQYQGDCYAMAATALVDGFRFSHGDKDYTRQIFPEYTAAAYQMEKSGVAGASLDSGGRIDKYLEQIRKDGACLIGPEKMLKLPDGNSAPSLEMLQKVLTIYDRYRAMVASGYTSGSKNSFFDSIKDGAACSRREGWASVFPDIHQLASAAGQASEAMMYHELMEPYCSIMKLDPAQLKLPPVRHEEFDYFTWASTIRKAIDKSLDASNPQPVAMSFDHHIYSDGRKFSYQGADHGAVIMGRRRGPKQQCQYLIRDSQGDFCGAGEKTADHAKNASDLSSDWECWESNLWIDADTLTKSIKAIDALGP